MTTIYGDNEKERSRENVRKVIEEIDRGVREEASHYHREPLGGAAAPTVKPAAASASPAQQRQQHHRQMNEAAASEH